MKPNLDEITKDFRGNSINAVQFGKLKDYTEFIDEYGAMLELLNRYDKWSVLDIACNNANNNLFEKDAKETYNHVIDSLSRHYESFLDLTGKKDAHEPDTSKLELVVRTEFPEQARTTLKKMFKGRESNYGDTSVLEGLEQQLKGTLYEIRNYQQNVRDAVQSKNKWTLARENQYYWTLVDGILLITSCDKDGSVNYCIEAESGKPLVYSINTAGKVTEITGRDSDLRIFESFKPFLLEVKNDDFKGFENYRELVGPLKIKIPIYGEKPVQDETKFRLPVYFTRPR